MVQTRHPLMPQAEWVSFPTVDNLRNELIAVIPGIQNEGSATLRDEFFEMLEERKHQIGRVIVHSTGVPAPTVVDIREKSRHPRTGKDQSTHILVLTATRLSQEGSGGRMHHLLRYTFF